jgi:hypothetical protein
MINWYNLLANCLWILALSLTLAILSYTRWEAQRQGERLQVRLNRSRRNDLLHLAGSFFVWVWRPHLNDGGKSACGFCYLFFLCCKDGDSGKHQGNLELLHNFGIDGNQKHI